MSLFHYVFVICVSICFVNCHSMINKQQPFYEKFKNKEQYKLVEIELFKNYDNGTISYPTNLAVRRDSNIVKAVFNEFYKGTEYYNFIKNKYGKKNEVTIKSLKDLENIEDSDSEDNECPEVPDER